MASATAMATGTKTNADVIASLSVIVKNLGHGETTLLVPANALWSKLL